MFKRLRIGTRLRLAFALVLGLLIVAIGLAALQMSRMGADFARVVAVYAEEHALASEMKFDVQSVQRYDRTILLSDDPSEIAANKGFIAKSRANYDRASEELNGLLISDQAKALFAKIQAAKVKSGPFNDQVVSLSDQGQRKEAISLLLGEARTDNAAWMDDLQAMCDFTKAQMKRGYADAESARQTAMGSLLVMGLITLILGLSAAVAITRSITKPLSDFVALLADVSRGNLTVQARVDSQDEVGQLGDALNRTLSDLRGTLRKVADSAASVASGATELSASAEQMSATTDQLARGGETIHASAETMAAAITQFSASVQEVAANVRVSVQHSESAVRAAEEGSRGGQEMAEGMTRIQTATGNIQKAVRVIQEIARQTNLLSLNAAIEAAKAGALGKGFAVVAEEVRKLAERSRQAAIEIEELLAESREAVDGGQATVQRTSHLLGEIREAIGAMSSMMLEIGSATEEQAHTSGDVERQVGDVSREVGQNASATQQISATVQEIARTAHDLARVSEELSSAMSRFKV